MNEEWKDIPGYEGIYQASSFGRIKSLDRRSGGMRNYKLRGRLLKTKPHDRTFVVGLTKNNKQTVKSVGYWVLTAFIGLPPDGFTMCVHRDGDKLNNAIENLMWGDQSVSERLKIEQGRYYNWSGISNKQRIAFAEWRRKDGRNVPIYT